MYKPEKRLVIAKSAGFCPGVKKAIDTVLTLAQEVNAPIYTLGPLIHNKHVIEALEEKNIHAISSPEEIKDKTGILVIRAHGITPELEKKIRALSMKVVDATCPLVKNVQRVIEKYANLGYSTVIVGDAGHAEVTGLLGYTQGRGYVVADSRQAKKLPPLEKVNIVAQTTQEEENFEKTAQVIAKRCKNTIISNTICFPTRERQKETITLAKSADLAIVVGGKNSANTRRLAKLCSKYCTKTIHIESEKELDGEIVRNAKNIIITAGASTPNWVTQRVYDFAAGMGKSKIKSIVKFAINLWKLIIDSGIYSASAAVALTYAASRLQSIKPDKKILFLAGFFVLGLTIINRAWQRVGSGDKDKEWLFVKHRFFSTATGFSLGLAALAISFFLGTKIFILSALFFLLGIIYPARRIFKISRVAAFPASKDLVTALGWAFVCSLIAVFYRASGFTRSDYLVFLYCVSIVFIRSVFLGVSSVRSDLIVGRETLYKAIGSKGTGVVLSVAIGFLTLTLLIVFSITFDLSVMAMLVICLCQIVYLGFYFGGKIPKNILAETLLDGQFLLLAFMIYLF